MAKRILRPAETQKRLGIKHSKFWDDIRKGILPPLVRLGPKSVGHLEEEIDKYIDDLRAARDGGEAA